MTFLFGSATADRAFGLEFLIIFAAILTIGHLINWLWERHRRLKGDTDLDRRVRRLEARREEEQQAMESYRKQVGTK